ncbi:MAG: response regulator [Terriglobia bacterium]|jgi:two-component system OmpR family response regulator
MAKRKFQSNIRETDADGRDLKLLLVDENANDLDYYTEVLRYLGYEVQPVNSYSRAAAALDRERFDLVIVDQGSADFEGRPVLSRAVEVDHHVPILVLSRTVDADCCIEALDAGAREYVQKPLTTVEVRELVTDYVKPSTLTFAGGHHPPMGMGGRNGGASDHEPLRKAS